YHAGDLAPAVGLRHRAHGTAQPLPQGVDALEDALPLAGKGAHQPLAPRAALKAEPVENRAEDQPAREPGEREFQQLAVFFVLLAFLAFLLLDRFTHGRPPPGPRACPARGWRGPRRCSAPGHQAASR